MLIHRAQSRVGAGGLRDLSGATAAEGGQGEKTVKQHAQNKTKQQ